MEQYRLSFILERIAHFAARVLSSFSVMWELPKPICEALLLELGQLYIAHILHIKVAHLTNHELPRDLIDCCGGIRSAAQIQ